MTRTIGRLCILAPAVFLLGAVAMAASVPASDQPAASTQGLAQMLARKIFIRGGCPYNLDKECERLPNGRLVHCRCVS
jgi:hypothetical protein